MSTRVAGIPGSLREGSLNKGLLRAAVGLAPAGMEIQIYTRLGGIPPYNDDVFQKGDPGRGADLNTGIQLRHSGRPQKCHRLGVAPVRQVCAESETRSNHGLLARAGWNHP